MATTAEATPKTVGGNKWTTNDAEKLQVGVDAIFGPGMDTARLKKMAFSLTLADPVLDGCPLIGCSSGFGTLCGYEMDEIIGRNCRFLLDPVPAEYVNDKVRRLAREFCHAVKHKKAYEMTEAEHEPWMPKQHNDNAIFVAQTNARKDGSLFDNMFYLRSFELDNKSFIAGLQTELPRGSLQASKEDKGALEACHEACQQLNQNWAEVERILAKTFWYTGPMRRQDDPDLGDGFVGEPDPYFSMEPEMVTDTPAGAGLLEVPNEQVCCSVACFLPRAS